MVGAAVLLGLDVVRKCLSAPVGLLGKGVVTRIIPEETERREEIDFRLRVLFQDPSDAVVNATALRDQLSFIVPV